MEEQKRQNVASRSLESEFVTYEQSLDLKELGFEWQTLNFFDSTTRDFWNWDYFPDINAPLKQQVLRWFRENHGLYANLFSWLHEEELGTYHEYEIYGNPNGVYGDGKYTTYEEAENAAINKLIEIVNQ